MKHMVTITPCNLFALDYLKDHDVTREQFESVWETLDDDIHQMYK